MRAVICPTLGEIDVLRMAEMPTPAVGPGQVRIAVHAAGVNFADGLLIAGRYQEKLEPPFVPGFEVAGVVEETGAGVSTCRPGDRVMAVVDGGGFAETAVAKADDVHVLPEAMDFVSAAGFPIAYGTSHFGLRERCRLGSGETLLVHGAAGGVGLTAVEIGHALGASVIATAGGADRLALPLSYGAAHGIDYKSEDVRERVKALTGGRGADVVYDPVGGEVFDASLRCTAPGGRILVVGFASGNVPQVPANLLLVKNLSVIGFYWGAYRKLAPGRIRASFDELLQWYETGRIKPLVTKTYDLADAARAIEALKRRTATSKLVLTTGRTE
jgi:NADPH2:quinone reductase